MFYSTLTWSQNATIAKTIQENASEIGNYFDTSVDLDLPDSEGVFNKKQATLVIKEFFTKIDVITYEFKHQGGGRSKSYFEIGQLKSAKQNYRTYILYNLIEDKPIIIEFRIDLEE